MKNKIQFYIGLIASGFLASSALAQFSLTNGGTNNISNGTPEVAPAIYVVDLVATAAFGVAMNDAGDVTGSSYPDPGCGSTCLPPLEPVVWKGGIRIERGRTLLLRT
jgi:hypothetical protein